MLAAGIVNAAAPSSSVFVVAPPGSCSFDTGATGASVPGSPHPQAQANASSDRLRRVTKNLERASDDIFGTTVPPPEHSNRAHERHLPTAFPARAMHRPRPVHACVL